ncbi:hypothetical protein Pfo_027668 [Paulownia fortunei]|nr:hypothetical protein Pfo_027668 [Paulownia fortunei]
MKPEIKVSKTADETQPSAQIVASIDGLLTEIFLRLPMKSLMRFKLVSKHFHSLISDPGFCLLRNPDPNPAVGLFFQCSNFNPNPAVGLFFQLSNFNPWCEYVPFSVNKSTNPLLRKLNFTEDPSGIRILQSCNGLLLCCSFPARDHKRRYYVCNPTTNKFSTLPELDGEGGIWTRILGMSLAFDPAKSPHYKVVCVRGLGIDLGEYGYQLEVYSSETGGPWRNCGEQHFTGQVNFEGGVYWNGSIHWLSDRSGDSLYFNPDDHQMPPKIMPNLPIPDGWCLTSNYYFGESCDHLHYTEIYGLQNPFSVYEMKRDYSEWFVKYQVDLSPVVDAYSSGMIQDNFSFFGIIQNTLVNFGKIQDNFDSTGLSISTMVRGEKEEDSFLVLKFQGKVIRYNLVDRTFETIDEFEDDEIETFSRFPCKIGFQYIESLCCV